MSTESKPDSEAEAAALPRGRVLSYVAMADTPTRVRIVSAGVVRVLGWILTVMAFFALSGLVWVVWREVQRYYEYKSYQSYFLSMGFAPKVMPSLTEWMRDSTHFDVFGVLLISLLTLIVGGTTLLACASPVKRGSKAGCYLSILILIPMMLCWLWVAVTTGGWAVMLGLAVGGSKPQPMGWLFLLGTAVAVVIVLLFWDLMDYLKWIARNPITEKPAMPFLPPRIL